MVEGPPRHGPEMGGGFVGGADGDRVERGAGLALGGGVAVDARQREGERAEEGRRVRRAAGGGDARGDAGPDGGPAVGVREAAQQRQEGPLARVGAPGAVHAEEILVLPAEEADEPGFAVALGRAPGERERRVERGEPVVRGGAVAREDLRGAEPRLGEEEAVGGGLFGTVRGGGGPFVRDGGEEPRGAVHGGVRGGFRGFRGGRGRDGGEEREKREGAWRGAADVHREASFFSRSRSVRTSPS